MTTIILRCHQSPFGNGAVPLHETKEADHVRFTDVIDHPELVEITAFVTDTRDADIRFLARIRLNREHLITCVKMGDPPPRVDPRQMILPVPLDEKEMAERAADVEAQRQRKEDKMLGSQCERCLLHLDELGYGLPVVIGHGEYGPVLCHPVCSECQEMPNQDGYHCQHVPVAK